MNEKRVFEAIFSVTIIGYTCELQGELVNMIYDRQYGWHYAVFMVYWWTANSAQADKKE